MTNWASSSEVERMHTGFFFSDGAKRFFSSRISQDAIKHGRSYYFVTSEQFDWKSPRLYTVRRFDMDDPQHVETVGEFQQYENRRQAWAAIRRMTAE